ncbi:hypothetical protein [Streptomyces sp. NPDC002690]
MSEWGVALIAAGSAIAGSAVTGWFTRSAGLRQASAARMAGEEQAAAARHAGEKQAEAIVATVHQTLESQVRGQQLSIKRDAYVTFLQAAHALAEDRKRDRGALDEALFAEAKRAYQVLWLEGTNAVTAHAQFFMRAVEDSLTDSSVGMDQIDRCLLDYVTVAQHHVQEPWTWMRRSRNSWISGQNT